MRGLANKLKTKNKMDDKTYSFPEDNGENRNFFDGILDLFLAAPPKDATKEEMSQWQFEHMRKCLNMTGCNVKTQEDADYFYKVFGAWCPLNYLSQFLATATKPFKEATPEILMAMWEHKELLLPLIEQMKDNLSDLLEERGLCPEYMKRKSDKQ